MAQYINKDALVAELKKRIRDYWSDSENTMGIYPYALEEVIKYTDTLEAKEINLVKEIDLDTEIMKYQKEIYDRDTTVRDVAKYFFNLGFNVQKGE